MKIIPAKKRSKPLKRAEKFAEYRERVASEPQTFTAMSSESLTRAALNILSSQMNFYSGGSYYGAAGNPPPMPGKLDSLAGKTPALRRARRARMLAAHAEWKARYDAQKPASSMLGGTINIRKPARYDLVRMTNSDWLIGDKFTEIVK